MGSGEKLPPQSLWGRGTVVFPIREKAEEWGGKCSCWSTDAGIKKV